MFSRLDSIFRTNFRETEPVDTRQAIHRKEDDRQGRSDQREKKAVSELFGADQTQVSVPALIVFLESLIAGTVTADKASGEAEKEASPVTRPDDSRSSENKDNSAQTPLARAATVAASVYEKTARQGQEKAVLTPAAPTESIVLKPEEQKAIAALIQDLKGLKQKGVENLTLPPGVSFLDSLQKAVRQTD